ncbi:MAG: DUF5667 domain-containing protein [bacterium]|nr:DUF5667 domain-containing protein [bacterium]
MLVPRDGARALRRCASTYVAAFFVLAGLAFAPAAYAQEELVAPDVAVAEDAALNAALDAAVDAAVAVQPVTEAEASALDVSTADLGATESRVLQDSPFYALKRFGRAVRKAVTRDPVKEAELRLRYANQELADAQRLADTKSTAGVADDVADGVAAARRELAAVAASGAALLAEKQDNGSAVERMVERIADSAFTQQRAVERIDRRINATVSEEEREQFHERLQQEQERMLTYVGGVVGTVDDPAFTAQRFSRALDNQPGSEFKHFKNIEVLKRLEAKVPEQARDAIRAAQEHGIQRMQEHLSEAPERAEEFRAYVEHAPGDAIIQTVILERMRAQPNVSPEFVKQMDALKAQAVGRFNAEFTAGSEGERSRLLERFRDADVDVVRAALQFKHYVPPEARAAIEQHEAEAIDRFSAAFSSDTNAQEVAGEAKRLMEKVRTNPEPADFAILEKLRTRLTQEQRTFVERLERDGQQRFESEFRARGQEYIEQFVDPANPGAVQTLEELSRRGVIGADRAFDVQRQRSQEYSNELEEKREVFAQQRRGKREQVREQILQGNEGDAEGRVERFMDLTPEERAEIERGRELFRKAIEGRPEFGGPNGSFGPPMNFGEPRARMPEADDGFERGMSPRPPGQFGAQQDPASGAGRPMPGFVPQAGEGFPGMPPQGGGEQEGMVPEQFRKFMERAQQPREDAASRGEASDRMRDGQERPEFLPAERRDGEWPGMFPQQPTEHRGENEERMRAERERTQPENLPVPTDPIRVLREYDAERRIEQPDGPREPMRIEVRDRADERTIIVSPPFSPPPFPMTPPAPDMPPPQFGGERMESSTGVPPVPPSFIPPEAPNAPPAPPSMPPSDAGSQPSGGDTPPPFSFLQPFRTFIALLP